MSDVKPWARDAAPLLLRLALGVIFVYHGAQKLGLLDEARSWATTVASVHAFGDGLSKLGLEPALPLAWAAALTEFFAGAFLLLGFATRASAASLVVVMAVAIWKVHAAVGFGLQRLETGGVRNGYEFNLLIIAASLALVLLGSGPLGLDPYLPGTGAGGEKKK
jgi:putative oxidoreductase